MFLLGLGETGLKALLEEFNYKPLPDFPTVLAATQAPLPTLLPGQKGVLVTVTVGGVTGVYTKTAEGVKLLNEGVAQTGVVTMKGGANAHTSQNSTVSMALIPLNEGRSGMQIVGSGPGHAAFMEFHIPNILVHQFGVDIDGQFVIRRWETNILHAIVANGLNDQLVLNDVLTNRKIVIFNGQGNDHQFYGIGLQNGTQRYQVQSGIDSHVFYAGTSPVTSKELLRVKGDGTVSVNGSTAGYALNVLGLPGQGGVIAEFLTQVNQGARLQIHQAGISVWRIGQPDAADAFVIEGWGSGAYPERLRIDLNGNVGVGTAAPTSRMHVKGAAGHDQFRLETKYTPTSSSDANGAIGQFAWDDNYTYMKVSVAPHTWKRSALSTF